MVTSITVDYAEIKYICRISHMVEFFHKKQTQVCTQNGTKKVTKRFLSLKSFGNQRSNYDTHFFGIIIQFRFTCGEQKLLKREKASKYFVQDCMKVFLLDFTSLKMHRISKNDLFLVERIIASLLQLSCSKYQFEKRMGLLKY